MSRVFSAFHLLLLSAFFAVGETAPRYQFPEGVPIKASEVEWYAPTDYYQNFEVTGGFRLDSRRTNRQTWNNEFPWKTGGVDRSDNAETFKFHRRSSAGHIGRTRGPQPTKFFDNDHASYFRWQLPPGELFGEVIKTDGRTTEVRLLEITEAKPRFRVFRPFATLAEIRPLVAQVFFTTGRLRNAHAKSIIDETALVADVALWPQDVETILARPFKDVTDVVFAAHDGRKCFAPTTTQRHGIVPRHYDGGFLHSKTCMACHQTAGAEGRQLDPNPAPDKYGNIRGGSFVFSFPFFESLPR